MWLAKFGESVCWELGLVGAVLLNVIEGGKRKISPHPQRGVDVGSILQALPQAAFLLDHRGKIGNANQSAERLTGQNRKQLLGAKADALIHRSVDAAETIDSLIARALAGETMRSGHTVFHLAGGETMRVIVTACPVCDRAGQVSGALLTIQDVTELAALQEHSDSNERHVAVGQMTAGLVHDFNNVLNTISEAVAVLELEQRPDRELTILSIISNAVHHGAETIRNTREYLVGTRERPARINIRRLLEEVLELTHPLLKTHTGVKVLRQTQDCGDVQASADELRRAFTNLVLNALDAMPQGGTLTVGCTQTEGRVLVSVRDTGIGIPQEEQKKIFSPYYTTKSKGTGLGLAGARRAIHAQQGEIRFESTPGVGTAFYVILPLASDAEFRTPNAA